MSNTEEIMTVATWLMAGGGIMAVFGLISIVHARYGDDRGGLSKPLTLVGLALFAIGFFLDQRWGSYW
jgi:hypothetical protein